MRNHLTAHDIANDIRMTRSQFKGSFLIGLLLCLILGATLTQADSPNQIALVVSYEDEVVTRCVEFEEEELTNYDVLDRSGLDLNIDPTNSMGVIICRIDGQGCNYPTEDCFCQCQGSECVYWSYWHLDDGDWQYSSSGASDHKVQPGAMEGWSWGDGSSGQGQEPPLIPFDEICLSSPTDTPTAMPTDTPIPTDTPMPTDTPIPTDTPMPTNTPMPTDTPMSTNTPMPTDTSEPLDSSPQSKAIEPVIHQFSTDRSTITAGEGATLSWDLSDAEVAYLRYDDYEAGVIAPSSQTVFPTQTTRYLLIAQHGDEQTTAELTITVNPADSSATHALETVSPIIEGDTPIMEGDTPVMEADTPVMEADTSVMEADTPIMETVTPIMETVTPIMEANTSVMETTSPDSVSTNSDPTDTPIPNQPLIQFETAASIIPRGACTQISWQTEHADTVYLNDVEVSGQGKQSVCPTEAQAYTVRAIGAGGEQERQVTLTVSEPLVLPTNTVPSSPSSPSSSSTIVLTQTPTPASTVIAARPIQEKAVQEREETVRSTPEQETTWETWLVYGGITAALLIFLIGPLVLLGLGSVVWWLKKR